MPAMDSDATELAPVRVAPAAELAAEQIRRAIAAGRYQPGDRLPNQRELSSQLRVSRTTLQDATQILVSEGLLIVRRGAHGGIRVLERPTPGPESTRAFLRQTVREVDDVLDMRVTLESGAAYLAAERRTTEDLTRMHDAFDAMQAVFDEGRMEAVAEFWQADVAFHRAIAQSTHNSSLSDAIEDARIQFLSPLGRVFTEVQEQAHDGHREILAAIEAGDTLAAAAAARDHIELTRSIVHQLAGPRSSAPRA